MLQKRFHATYFTLQKPHFINLQKGIAYVSETLSFRTGKETMESIAKSRGISLSWLCYGQIVPLLSDPLELSPEGRTGSKNSLKLNRCVKVYFTDSEYQELLTASKGLPLSRFIRKEYLSRKEPVVISVYTDDISALAVKVSAYIEQLNNFIAALAIRRQLYEADYQKLIQITNDTQIALKEVATYTKNNRKSIRAAGVRILRKEIHRAVQQYFSDTVASSGRPQKERERS